MCRTDSSAPPPASAAGPRGPGTAIPRTPEAALAEPAPHPGSGRSPRERSRSRDRAASSSDPPSVWAASAAAPPPPVPAVPYGVMPPGAYLGPMLTGPMSPVSLMPVMAPAMGGQPVRAVGFVAPRGFPPSAFHPQAPPLAFVGMPGTPFQPLGFVPPHCPPTPWPVGRGQQPQPQPHQHPQQHPQQQPQHGGDQPPQPPVPGPDPAVGAAAAPAAAAAAVAGANAAGVAEAAAGADAPPPAPVAARPGPRPPWGRPRKWPQEVDVQNDWIVAHPVFNGPSSQLDHPMRSSAHPSHMMRTVETVLVCVVCGEWVNRNFSRKLTQVQPGAVHCGAWDELSCHIH